MICRNHGEKNVTYINVVTLLLFKLSRKSTSPKNYSSSAEHFSNLYLFSPLFHDCLPNFSESFLLTTLFFLQHSDLIPFLAQLQFIILFFFFYFGSVRKLRFHYCTINHIRRVYSRSAIWTCLLCHYCCHYCWMLVILEINSNGKCHKQRHTERKPKKKKKIVPPTNKSVCWNMLTWDMSQYGHRNQWNSCSRTDGHGEQLSCW